MMMDHYHHFGIATYMYAYYAAEAEDVRIREDMEKYLKYLPLDKVYVENHRGLVDVPYGKAADPGIYQDGRDDGSCGIPRHL